MKALTSGLLTLFARVLILSVLVLLLVVVADSLFFEAPEANKLFAYLLYFLPAFGLFFLFAVNAFLISKTMSSIQHSWFADVLSIILTSIVWFLMIFLISSYESISLEGFWIPCVTCAL